MDPLNLFAKRADEEVDEASNSASGLVSTLIPTLVIAGVMVLLFVILRRSNRRQYIPRTYIGSLSEQERTPEPEPGLFGWISSMGKLPDTYVLRHHSLDAYLLLRYLKVATTICFVGCLITWPVLFPVNITGGGGKKQLDMLSFGNVKGDLNRYYAHTFIAWIFIAFIFFMVTRENLYFINLRQAYFLSPLYASRISSKTVLLSSVPQEYLSESKIRRMYGNENVKNVWLATDVKELEGLVDDRDTAAFKLEGAETNLIKQATVNRAKALKGRQNDEENLGDDVSNENMADGESGSVASKWVPASKRPTHKLKPLIGKKVDTINWARMEIERLDPEIDALQAQHREGNAKIISSVFVEFYTQNQAQAAYQMLAHSQPLHMAPRYIGLNPNDIIWSNLRIKWWELVIRNAVTIGFVVALVIFWAIPVAVVGAISNINFLQEKVPFLSFISDVPPVILGVITALLPAILLAVLMALLPIILRIMAKHGGCPTTPAVELRTQNFYFAFQVVQVFLVTTISSAASSAVSSIIQEPASAAELLAENIPKAANFYIAYFILQGLTFSAGALLQIVGLIISKVLGRLLDNTPRKMYKRWSTLSGMGWGTVFPILSNLCVIAITYGAIAPLVLGFATVGLFLFYIAYKYNMLYVTNAGIDTKGMVYPRALQHTLVGCYLLIVCLIGLFAIGTASDPSAVGPLILMIIFLVGCVLYHVSLNNAITPLLNYLPKNLEVEEEEQRLLSHGPSANGGGYEEATLDISGGGPSGNGIATDPEKAMAANGSASDPQQPKPSAIQKFLQPNKHADYFALRNLVPHDFADISYSPETERDAYYHPSIKSNPPLLWIPRDEAGVSRQEVAHTSKVIRITDEDASIDDAGKITWNEDKGMPPIYQEKVYY